MDFAKQLPVAIVGAGPVGLAAAAHTLSRGMTPVVLEKGPSAGHNIRQWGHVRVFSPWRYNIDQVSAGLLRQTDWQEPELDYYPTGHQIVDEYLEPLATHPAIAPHVRFDSEVVAVTRAGKDKMKTAGRDDAPFLLRVRSGDGREQAILASAVIDASGTYGNPNPLGTGGIPALGETALRARITYGVPDVLGSGRERFAGKRVLVIGGGDSAFNSLISLIELRNDEPSTEIFWAVRRSSEEINFGGGENDQLPQRGALGRRVQRILAQGEVTLVPDFQLNALALSGDAIMVHAEQSTLLVDEIVAVTGYRPDLAMLRELRLALDTAVESPTELAPLIDPNVHSCGTVRPHGAIELGHPETDFYIAGMKSYGRAPTFLMVTGYEQVRSIVAALDGDWEAARDVQLELPETGVCSVSQPALVLAAAGAESGDPSVDSASSCCAPTCCS